MGFLPRDQTELLLAGHCVMMHDAMSVIFQDAFHGETDPARRGKGLSLVSLNKAFNDNLDRLERCRLRPASGTRGTPAAPPAATEDVGPARVPTHLEAPTGEPAPAYVQPNSEPPVTMNRAARRQAARAEKRAAATSSRKHVPARTPPEPTPVSPSQAPNPNRPSAEAIAACRANPEAMAALKAGDPARFARALGVAAPSKAFISAASLPGTPFDPQSPGPWPAGAVAETSKL
jgi:hypothetical protein